MLGSGIRVWGLRILVSCFVLRVLAFGFQISGFGFRVSGFGFQVSDFEFRVSDFHTSEELTELRDIRRAGVRGSAPGVMVWDLGFGV
jgi:hypothetical protein